MLYGVVLSSRPRCVCLVTVGVALCCVGMGMVRMPVLFFVVVETSLYV